MTKWITAVLLVLVSGLGSIPVGAVEPGEPPTEQQSINVRTTMSAGGAASLPYEHLGDYTSTPGETEHAFLIRMGPVFRAFADRTTEEACAEIGATADSTSWGLVVGTNHSHLGCVIDSAHVLPGMTATGVTIHTHGKKRWNFDLSAIDRELTGMPTDGHPHRIQGENVDHFSPTDFATGPGYLTTPTGLLYQAGKPGTEVAVAP